MKNDANSRGIALHLERLIRRDEEWFAGLEEVFDEARRVAQEEGIELTLPGTAPRNNRKCEFVESDGAFVSWDGDVHPCYFLWHRYRCYVGGLEKQVRPWVFGNLGIRTLQRYGTVRFTVTSGKMFGDINSLSASTAVSRSAIMSRARILSRTAIYSRCLAAPASGAPDCFGAFSSRLSPGFSLIFKNFKIE